MAAARSSRWVPTDRRSCNATDAKRNDDAHSGANNTPLSGILAVYRLSMWQTRTILMVSVIWDFPMHDHPDNT